MTTVVAATAVASRIADLLPTTTSTTTTFGHDENAAPLSSSSSYPVVVVEQEEELDAETPFHQLMNRGNYLRQLRLLALTDEMEREQHQQQQTASTPTTGTTTSTNTTMTAGFYEEKKEEDELFFINDNHSRFEEKGQELTELTMQEDVIHTLSSTTTHLTMLNYNSYLAHQRYYDDLKHVDINFIDYGHIIGNRNYKSSSSDGIGGRLIVEQRKRLGKGGLCWDAAFILGEHVIHQVDEWNPGVGEARTTATTTTIAGPPRVVELGAGTGLCGMMVAKAIRCHVEMTDLPELYDLMSANIESNFGRDKDDDNYDDPASTPTCINSPDLDYNHKSMGTISSRVLRWGIESDYQGAPYDCILGADIVTNLYNPVALAQTIHALSGPNSRIYISGKARLDKPHEEFDVEMQRLFESVKKIQMDGIYSRLRSPNVFIIVAEGKRSM